VPLLKRRPELLLFASRTLRVGRSFEARVVIACAEPVPVDYVDVELRGDLVEYVDTQYGRSERHIGFLRQRARIHGPGDLATGEHPWVVVFNLPARAPPSYAGATFRVEYTVHVHASIPWWPDARAVFALQVLGAPAPPQGDGRPRVFASDAAGARGTEPFVELSLARTEVAPGEPLTGALALANTAHHTYREAELSLVAVESSRSLLGRHDHPRPLCRWALSLAELGDGEPLRFRLQIPAGVCPGFDQGDHSLRWYLEARIKVAWARDPRVWIPLVVTESQIDDGAQEPAPLAVGSERIDLLWRSIAEQSGLELLHGALVGRFGATTLRIAREPRGRRGTIVAASVDLPDLGIGLRLDDDGPRPRLAGRDAAQVTWLEGHLSAALERRPPAGANDRGLAFELDDPGQVHTTLRPFVDDLKAIAALLEGLRAQIPPPTAMAALVPAWERAASHLGGHLRPGPMAIVGRADDAAIELRTEWDDAGRPQRTLFELRPAAAIDERHHLTWHARSGGPPASALPLEPLWSGAHALEIDRDGVRVALDGPLADPLTELGRISALVALGDRLQGRRGPFR